MTVPAVTRMGSWVLDRRGQGRGVRITRHPEMHAINLSIWRDSVCAGTVHLTPADAAEVVQAITVQLAELAGPARPAPPVHTAGLVDELEARIAQLERRGLPPAPRRRVWRRAVDKLVDLSSAHPFGTPDPPPPVPSGPLLVVR